jgi:hypothetical protein
MNKKNFFITAFFLLQPLISSAQDAEIKWDRYPPGCENLHKQEKAYPLSMFDLFMNQISPTKISILSKNKIVCVDLAVATGKHEEGNAIYIFFEKGKLICEQRSDEARLAGDDVKQLGYKIAGVGARAQNNSLILTDCQFFR